MFTAKVSHTASLMRRWAGGEVQYISRCPIKYSTVVFGYIEKCDQGQLAMRINPPPFPPPAEWVFFVSPHRVGYGLDQLQEIHLDS